MRGISPQSVEIIKLPRFLFKDMKDHVIVIDENPKARLAAFDPNRLRALFSESVVNRIDDGPNLRLRFRGADDKKVGEGGQVADMINGNFLSVLRLGGRRNEKGLRLGIPDRFLCADFLGILRNRYPL